MAESTVVYAVRVERMVYRKLHAIAKAEQRPLGNLVRKLLSDAVKDYEAAQAPTMPTPAPAAEQSALEA